jgi:hypothetical protein
MGFEPTTFCMASVVERPQRTPKWFCRAAQRLYPNTASLPSIPADSGGSGGIQATLA